jgi:hypothetical protein
MRTHHFDAVDESMLRILINLREREDQHVALGVTISPKRDQKILCWLDMTRPFATILPGTLTELTFMSGNGVIPTKRRDNGRSVYVIMDIVPLKDTQYNVADEIQRSMGVKKEQFISQLQRMHKNGSLSTEKFEEMMKDPETAFLKMMKDETTAETTDDTENPAPQKQVDPMSADSNNAEQQQSLTEEEDDCEMGAPAHSVVHDEQTDLEATVVVEAS